MDKTECQSPIAGKMSSAQLRKIKKPVIEKRRRERINDSLNQLKALVLDAMQKDESRYSKMEKADILEMTVHHLKNMHRRQKLIHSEDQEVVPQQKYTTGFTECAKEVGQFLSNTEGLSQDMQLRMMSHLSQCIQKPARTQQQQPITPAPIVISPQVYREPVSPQGAHATVPCATSTAALPGSPNSQYSPVHSMSPISLVTTSPVPMAFSSGVVLVSPTGSTHSSVSPAHSPSSMNNAIPLYTNGHKYSSVSPPPRPTAVYHSQRYEQIRAHSSSPVMADDVPMQFSLEECQRMRDTVIAKSTHSGPVSSCKSEARMAYHNDNMMARSMWRPW